MKKAFNINAGPDLSSPSCADGPSTKPLSFFSKWHAARQEAHFQAGMAYWNKADPTERSFIESEPQTSSAFDRGILAARSAGPQ
jgi:hypothetical protein